MNRLSTEDRTRLYVARWNPPTGGKVVIIEPTWRKATKAARYLVTKMGALKVSLEVK